jgi:hypothetical protein
MFGGDIRELPTDGNRKQKYCWYTYSRSITKDLQPYLVLKAAQCILANQFYALGNEKNPEARFDLMQSIQIENQKFDPAVKLTIRPSIQPSKEDIAYLAGLFDAEGTFAIVKRNIIGNGSYTSYAKISNTDGRVFPWIMSRFGGSMCVNDRGEYRDEGVWTMSGKKERETKVLSMLPYMNTKKLRAELFLHWMQNNNRMTNLEKHDCFSTMQRLNLRGKSPEANTSGTSNEVKIESDLMGDPEQAPLVTLVA